MVQVRWIVTGWWKRRLRGTREELERSWRGVGEELERSWRRRGMQNKEYICIIYLLLTI
jgi:hypothetical protein